MADHYHSNKYITTPEFNKLTSENFAARLKQAILVSKSDIVHFVIKTDFDNQVKNVASHKNEWNEVKVVKSKEVKSVSEKGLTKDLTDKFSILNGAKYFSLGIFQNYLVFIPDVKYIKYFHAFTRIYSWKSNGMLEESIKNVIKLDRILLQLLWIIMYYQRWMLMDAV